MPGARSARAALLTSRSSRRAHVALEPTSVLVDAVSSALLTERRPCPGLTWGSLGPRRVLTSRSQTEVYMYYVI